MRKLAFAAVLFLVPTLLSAQVVSRTRTFSQLGTCTKDGEIKIIVDAATAGTCAGGGTSLAACWCDLGTATWISQPVPAAALGAYVPVTKAGQQTLTATGTGNDVTIDTADDLIITLGDDFVVNGGNYDVLDINLGTNGQGASYLDFGGGAFNAFGEDGTHIFKFEAAPTGFAFGIDTGYELQISDGNLDLSAATIIDAGGGANEVTVATNSTTILGSLILPIASAPPAACADGTKGTIYYDSDINKLCVCNATNYVLVDDSSTTTGCS